MIKHGEINLKYISYSSLYMNKDKSVGVKFLLLLNQGYTHTMEDSLGLWYYKEIFWLYINNYRVVISSQ